MFPFRSGQSLPCKKTCWLGVGGGGERENGAVMESNTQGAASVPGPSFLLPASHRPFQAGPGLPALHPRPAPPTSSFYLQVAGLLTAASPLPRLLGSIAYVPGAAQQGNGRGISRNYSAGSGEEKQSLLKTNAKARVVRLWQKEGKALWRFKVSQHYSYITFKDHTSQ